MTRLLIASLLLAGACADPHMGDLYGRRTRTALDAQRDAKTEGIAIDAADAKLVSQRFHSTPTQGAQQQGAATLSIPVTGYGGSSGGSSTMGGVQPSGPPAGGGIRLDAVR